MAQCNPVAGLPVAQGCFFVGRIAGIVWGYGGRCSVADRVANLATKLDAETKPEGGCVDLAGNCHLIGRGLGLHSRAFALWSWFEAGQEPQLPGGSFCQQAVRQGKLLAGTAGKGERSD